MGKAVAGIVKRKFVSNNKPAYTVALFNAALVDGESKKMVSIGGMAGFEMALQAAGLEGLLVGDKVHVECTGTKPPEEEGHSPMVTFAVEVDRGGKTYKGRTEDAGGPFLNAAFWTGEKTA